MGNDGSLEQGRNGGVVRGVELGNNLEEKFIRIFGGMDMECKERKRIYLQGKFQRWDCLFMCMIYFNIRKYELRSRYWVDIWVMVLID